MCKKAFTLYEVAVVLIVIGIILGMLFQTTSLANVAKLKKDCSVIEKMRSAFVTYTQAYQVLPGDTNGTGVVLLANSDRAMAQLVTNGLMTKDDFKYTVLIGNAGNTDFYTYRFTRCVANDGSFDSGTEDDVHSYAIRNNTLMGPTAAGKPNMPLGNTCVGLHDIDGAKNPCLDHASNPTVDDMSAPACIDFDNGDSINDFDGKTPKNLAAAFELYFDDGDFNLGGARRASSDIMPFTGNITYPDPREELRKDLKNKGFIKDNYLGPGGGNIYLIKIW